MLTQIDNEGQFFVITYARRKLQKYEQKYTQLFYIHVKIKDFDIKMARQLWQTQDTRITKLNLNIVIIGFPEQ